MHAETTERRVDFCRESSVSVVDHKSAPRLFIHELSKLLNRPCGCRMFRDADMEQSPGAVLHGNKYIKDTEPGGDRDKEVAGHDCLGVIAKEGRPTLVFRSRRSGPVLQIPGDCPW